jgi:hypothetical protein
VAPLLEELFLKPRGVVDVNGASEGEIVLGTPMGSTFAWPLCRYLAANRHRPVPWPAFVQELSAQAASFRLACSPLGHFDPLTGVRSVTQRVRVWSLPDGAVPGTPAVTGQAMPGQLLGPIPNVPVPLPPRLGVKPMEDGGQGVRVAAVVLGSPATRTEIVPPGGVFYMVEPGDVILAVNGQPIQSVPHFAQLVQASPRVMTLLVVNGRLGTLQVGTVLAY